MCFENSDLQEMFQDVKEIGNELYEMVSMPTKAFVFQLEGSTPKQLAR
jgi:hypothetical protein